MGPLTMKNEFRIPQAMFDSLQKHLFPGDNDEHGAVIAAGICRSARGTRFLARKLFIAREGVDYIPGKFGYRALTAEFVARVSGYCSKNKLAYFAIHNHGGEGSVGFSGDDLASHKRGYPALLDINKGVPVGALVFAKGAVAGEIWTRSGVEALDSMVVVGMNHQRLFPRPHLMPAELEEVYHRQSLLFGQKGQQILKGAKVGIIGMGGVGSLVNEWLARLGVGEILAIDYDKLEPSNRSRVVGSKWWDAPELLLNSSHGWLRRLGMRASKYKVHIGRRVALTANPAIRYEPIVGSISQESVALKLKDADYIFLCADSMESRLVFNALVHQYLVAGVEIGSKVQVAGATGAITDIFCATRPVIPQSLGGCLWCNQLINPSKLQEEAVSPEQLKRQKYVSDEAVGAPSVITLNALGAAQAANEFLFSMVGLHQNDGLKTEMRLNYPRVRKLVKGENAYTPTCLHCGEGLNAVIGRGDGADLPCRT